MRHRGNSTELNITLRGKVTLRAEALSEILSLQLRIPSDFPHIFDDDKISSSRTVPLEIIRSGFDDIPILLRL